jgi:hypothetical protein
MDCIGHVAGEDFDHHATGTLESIDAVLLGGEDRMEEIEAGRSDKKPRKNQAGKIMVSGLAKKLNLEDGIKVRAVGKPADVTKVMKELLQMDKIDIKTLKQAYEQR